VFEADTTTSELAALRARLSAAEQRSAELQVALDRSEAREQTLVDELEHRIRNMLGLIRSIYRRMREGGASQDEFAEHFIGRLDVIARYQANLVDAQRPGVELEDVIWNELLQVHLPAGAKLTVSGPPILLQQKALELFALAIHELTTNAIKFGALRHGGILTIDWTASDRALLWQWSETTVPMLAAAPRPRGFGQQLVEEALPYQLGATTSFEFRPGGVKCSIELPLPRPDAIQNADADADAAADADADAPFYAAEPE
jgi:two-component system CheB/CheR fusion protein